MLSLGHDAALGDVERAMGEGEEPTIDTTDLLKASDIHCHSARSDCVAIDSVDALTKQDLVSANTTIEFPSPETFQCVIASSEVRSSSTSEYPLKGIEGVISVAAQQAILSCSPVQGVIASQAAEGVVASAAGQ